MDTDKTRERIAALSALRRLKDNPDFTVLLRFMEAQRDLRLKQLARPLLTDADRHEHNVLWGEINGLRLGIEAVTILEAALERDEQKKL